MIRCLLLLAAAAHAQTVQGTAVNKVTHKPVAGALIELTSIPEEGDPDIYRGRTDETGHFRFDQVVPGHYRATADAKGFVRMQFESRGPRITVERSPAPLEITIPMTPAAVISGRVIDQDGDPIRYASVEAVRYGYAGGKKKLERVGNVRTDDRGEYRMFGLVPGKYYVRAMLRAGPVSEYLPTYFPGTGDVAQAALVEAPPGGETRSVDLLLHPARAYSISGKVIDGRTGQAAKSVYVSANTADGYSGGGPQTDGSFEIHNLMPGKYVLFSQEFSNGSPRIARQSVELGSADLTGVQLTLVDLLEVSGVIRIGGEVPGDSAKMQVSLEGEDFDSGVAVSAQGAFHFPRVRPDIYRLAWTFPKGYYVKSIKMGDRLLPDDRVDLTGPVAPLVVQLATDGGRVQGTVRNAAGEPVSGAVVTLTAEPSYDFWSATSDDKGQFEIRDIAPGNYKLLAFEDAPEGAPQDSDFRKPYNKSAVSVEVLPSTQQKIDVVAVK